MENLYKSLTINERIDAIKSYSTDYFRYDDIALYNWRNDMSIVSESNFIRMLEKNRYDAIEFQTVINYNPDNNLVNLYKEYAKNMQWYKEFISIINSEADISVKDDDLIFILRKFIFYGYIKISKTASELERIDIPRKVIVKMVNEIGTKLIEQSIKTIVTEVNLMRENGLLKSETSSERFKEFIRNFHNEDTIISFFDKYIVLARVLTETTIRIVNYICELIHNIDKDVFLLTRNETLYRKSELSDIDFNL